MVSDDDDISIRVRSWANYIAPVAYARFTDDLSVGDRIEMGLLPAVLDGADWRIYQAYDHDRSWDGFCRMIGGVMWVRCQAFEREADAEWEAEDYR